MLNIIIIIERWICLITHINTNVINNTQKANDTLGNIKLTFLNEAVGHKDLH